MDLDLVIALPDGSPWKPDSFSAAYADFAVKIGLAHIRFHDLRHSRASQLLRQRVPLKTVQERLGHVNAAVTLNTYAHVLAGDDQLAVENFELKFAIRYGKAEGQEGKLMRAFAPRLHGRSDCRFQARRQDR